MTAGRYAADTSVTPGRTREEIERTLSRYGATGFMFGQDQTGAAIAFLIRDRHVRFQVPLPSASDFALTPTRRKRTVAQIRTEHDKAVRSRWRALLLIVKAKLEAVEAGVVGFDEEFLAHLVMPGGQTVAELVGPGIAEAYASGTTPQLLPTPAPALGAGR